MIGITTGDSIRVKGSGGTDGKRFGNLFVNIRVKDHPKFQRNKLDIHFEVPVSVSEAVLGATKEVEGLRGKEKITIAAGTQPLDQYRLRGKGVQMKGVSGDQVVHFRVVIPT